MTFHKTSTEDGSGTQESYIVKKEKLDFEYIERTAYASRLQIVERWLPGGKFHAHASDEYVALNPKRSDNRLGSFKVNMSSLLWADFATSDSGKGLISLAAYLFDLSSYQAALQLAQMIGVEELAYVK
ncbi:MAG: hypothetical protein MRY32_02755 [Rickettsiales bacterium]|nr:hypothetical protein [Rickettsiales bacterium]